MPLADLVTGGVRGAMALLAAAVLPMLLLAAANVAGLVMIGADARRHDMAVRAALGASRARLVRQLAVEHGVLALAGGVAGARPGRRRRPRGGGVRPGDPAAGIGPRARLVGAGACSPRAAVAGAVCGVVPVLRLSRASAASLADATRGSAARPRQRVRQALVVVQVAASVMLLLGATLLVRTLVSLQAVDLGVRTQGVLTAEVQLPAATYPAPADVVGFYRRVTDQLAELPGVRAAGAVRVLPLSRTIGDWSIRLEGRPYSPAENPNADYQAVTPGYFQAIGLRWSAAAASPAADREDAPLVAVINETMASRYWPGQEAIGQRFMMGTDDKPWLTIVGVVGQVRHNAVVEPPRAEMYIAHAQLPGHIGSAPRGMALVVRHGDAAAAATGLRAVVRGLDAAARGRQRAHDGRSGRVAPGHRSLHRGAAQRLCRPCAHPRRGRSLRRGVARHRRARPRDRRADGAGRRTWRDPAAGAGRGRGAHGRRRGDWGRRLGPVRAHHRAQLYGVSPHDPAAFVGVPVLFSSVALVASLMPARRAARLDPLTRSAAETHAD